MITMNDDNPGLPGACSNCVLQLDKQMDEVGGKMDVVSAVPSLQELACQALCLKKSLPGASNKSCQ